jgi:hypothetical protein
VGIKAGENLVISAFPAQAQTQNRRVFGILETIHSNPHIDFRYATRFYFFIGEEYELPNGGRKVMDLFSALRTIPEEIND